MLGRLKRVVAALVGLPLTILLACVLLLVVTVLMALVGLSITASTLVATGTLSWVALKESMLFVVDIFILVITFVMEVIEGLRGKSVGKE